MAQGKRSDQIQSSQATLLACVFTAIALVVMEAWGFLG